jgi:hypothetical protein
MAPVWKLLIDLDGDQSYSHDAGGSLVAWDTDRGLDGPTGIAKAGTLRAVVLSTDGLYYLDRPEGLEGLQRGRHIKLQALVSGELLQIAEGRISEILPELAEGGTPWRAEIIAEDAMIFLGAKEVELDLQTSVGFGNLVRKVLDRAEDPGEREVSETVGEAKYAWFEDTTGLAALAEIAEAEGGTFFIDRNGRRVYQGRHYRPVHAATPVLDISSLVVAASQGDHDVVTNLRVVVNEIKDERTQEVWSHGSIPFRLDPHETRIFMAEYSDPVKRILPPRKKVDYRAEDDQGQEQGADRTDKLDVSLLDKFVTHCRVKVRNKTSIHLKVTRFRLRGKPLRWQHPTKLSFSAEDIEVIGQMILGSTPLGSSDALLADNPEGAYLRRREVIDNRLVQKESVGEGLGKYYFSLLSKTQPPVEATLIGSTDTRVRDLLKLEISNRLALLHEELGIDGDYWLDRIHHQWRVDDVLRTSVGLFPAYEIDPDRILGNPAAVLVHSPLLTAMSFDGVDDWVDIGDVLDQTGPFTAELWFNPTRVGPAFLFGKDTGASGWETQFDIDRRLRFLTRDLSNTGLTGTVQIALSTWHHVAVTWDPTADVKRLYLDGALEAEATGVTGAIPDTAAALAIGSRDGAIEMFQGQAHDVRLWNVVRTAEEIKNAMTLELVGDEDGLVGLWKLKAIT